MAVIGPYGLALEVPELGPGIDFYTRAGLEVEHDGNHARFRCRGRAEVCLTLIGGAPRKRLHHVALRADPAQLDAARKAVPTHGGAIIAAPAGFTSSALWLRDPHGTRVCLVPAAPEAPLEPVPPFQINEPGRVVRQDRAGIPQKVAQQPIRPLRLGHVLLYTPNVTRSIAFFTHALGMRLTDHSADRVAFMCTPKNSDHHVVAFAHSGAIGFHHASFQVAGPDEVGRGGRALADGSKRGDWGFGRHTIGANFFHYIQDPWGSWFEYFADIDFISDYEQWRPTDYASEDSLYNWGPAVPNDFVHNYEADDAANAAAKGF